MAGSTRLGYEIKTDYKGLDALWKRLQDLNQKDIQYGYFEDNRYTEGDRAGTPVASIAWQHETGMSDNAAGPSNENVSFPARPFFTQSLEKAKWFVRQSAPSVFLASFQGKQEKSFVQMGQWLKESIQDTIDEQNFVPNAALTIALKKSDKILVETGTLRNSVEAKIVNSDAYGKRKKEVGI